MLSLIESNPDIFRLSAFFATFCLLALMEVFFPRRQLTLNKAKRWANNLGLTFFNTLMIRVVFPFTAVNFAVFCQAKEIGTFNLFSLPSFVALIVSMLALDAIIWLQHLIAHRIPLLWRLHQVHHADLNLDLSSAARFHTLEMLLSMLVKFATIAILGAPALAVLLFEVCLSSFAMFNHTNMKLPLWLDNMVRVLIVTPDMHRVHHSIYKSESNSNFGFCLSIWDKMFNTYCANPKDGQLGMVIGLKKHLCEQETVPLLSQLMMPFKKNSDVKVKMK